MINALLGFFWSAGSVAGPVISSLVISVSGYDGLLITLLASGGLFLLIQCLGKTEQTLLAAADEDSDDDDDAQPATA